MAQLENPSRLDKIIALLTTSGKPLNIDDLAQRLHLPLLKVRSVLTPYQAKVVKVGFKTFDLARRVYKGRVFRYTPASTDLQHKGIHYNSDIAFLLNGYTSHYDEPIQIQSEGDNFILKRPSSGPHRHYLMGLKSWLGDSNFQPGDDLIFTCLDLPARKYSLRREQVSSRDTVAISHKNHALADFVYQLLLYEPNHYADTMFLIRKYAFEFTGFSDPAPDMLLHAIAQDSRFITNQQDQMYSWGATPLFNKHIAREAVEIGLRKYYLESRDHNFYPVSIQTNDDFAIKEAWCTHCWKRVKWAGDHWVHIYSEQEIFDCEVTKDFYKFDSRNKLPIKQKEITMSNKKPKSLPISLADFQYIQDKEWQYFLHEIVCNVWCPKCIDTVSIEKYTAELNDLNDVILHGECDHCHSPVARYLETGEDPRCLPRIVKVRTELSRAK